MKTALFCAFFLLITLTVGFSQDGNKQIEAVKIENPLQIDGVLDEDVYLAAPFAADFYQLAPYRGKPAFQDSKVYFFYDQTAIYLGAMLYDENPDSIFNNLSERDNIGVSDYFGVYLDPYNKGQLAYGFFVNAAGVQTDIKAIKSEYDYEDGSWDAVWESATSITDKGWIVEMRIPYSAIRFSADNPGVWGMNMFRNIRRYNSNNSWNYIDDKIDGFIHQQGKLTGIKDITPPVRLSVTPYAAIYEEFEEETHSSDMFFKGGLDLKYGVSEAYTLDMMLIPDFGQVQSDDKQLNLSPFEIYYNEKRQFFTEGTELFDRGNIFYSRRIGASPKFSGIADDTLKENEIIDYRPSETQLINATKISGRGNNGWGLGMLNAMSLKSEARIKDTISNETRDVQIQPFTNYNVAVVDKSLPNNSYVSFINTNVLMYNTSFMADVLATEFQLRDKKMRVALKGNGAVSYKRETTVQTGYKGYLSLHKNKGKLQGMVGQEVISNTYNPNDLGYIQMNNIVKTEGNLFYFANDPHLIFLNWYAFIYGSLNYHYEPFDLMNKFLRTGYFARFTNNYTFYTQWQYTSDYRNYYATRVDSMYVNESYMYDGYVNFSSDFRKPLQIYASVSGFQKLRTEEYGYSGALGANIRAGQRLKFNIECDLDQSKDILDFYDKTDENAEIYFVRHDVFRVEEIFNTSFAFNNKASINLRQRLYYSGVSNHEGYLLHNDGSLTLADNYTTTDQNYLYFNIDMTFRWIFAPGSELVVAWKNSISNGEEISPIDYRRRLGQNLIESDQINTLSLKVLYYLDYNNVRKGKFF